MGAQNNRTWCSSRSQVAQWCNVDDRPSAAPQCWFREAVYVSVDHLLTYINSTEEPCYACHQLKRQHGRLEHHVQLFWASIFCTVAYRLKVRSISVKFKVQRRILDCVAGISHSAPQHTHQVSTLHWKTRMSHVKRRNVKAKYGYWLGLWKTRMSDCVASKSYFTPYKHMYMEHWIWIRMLHVNEPHCIWNVDTELWMGNVELLKLNIGV